jgi:hypothetical protein
MTTHLDGLRPVHPTQETQSTRAPHYVRKPTTTVLYTKVKAMEADGLGITQIADALDAEGILVPDDVPVHPGGRRWWAGAVDAVLDREDLHDPELSIAPDRRHYPRNAGPEGNDR